MPIHHWYFLIIAGFISISLIFVPIIYIGYGMDLEGSFQFKELYIGVFSLAGLLAIISGRQISSIRTMGTILFITGLCSVTGYHFYI